MYLALLRQSAHARLLELKFRGTNWPNEDNTNATFSSRRMNESVATQPTPSPPKPLLYPQRVVLALKKRFA